MTTRAQLKAETEARREARAALIARVLELDDQGLKGGEIAKLVDRSPMAVSVILCDNGRRKKTRGVRRPQTRTTESRKCIICGDAFDVRTDHKSERCAKCVPRIQPGHRPWNKGFDEGQMPRCCETCGAKFKINKAALRKRPNYRWGTYCSKACYGEAMSTPGSRWSEVGKNWPSRRHGRKR